jgi:hypothetical protein
MPASAPPRARRPPRRKKLPVGLIPMLVAVPVGLICAVIAPFYEVGAALGAVLFTPLLIFAIVRVYLLARKKGLSDEMDAASHRITGNAIWLLALQINYAFTRPRVFACWVILEFFSMVVVIESGVLMDLQPAAWSAPAASNQASGPRNNQPQADQAPALLAKLDYPQGDQRRYDGAWGLGSMQADPKRQPEVARKLASLLSSTDPRLVNDVTRALAVWATPAEVPALLQAAANPDFSKRDEVIGILGKLRDERAVGPLVSLLKDDRTRPAADGAVKNLGPIAEKEVLKLFNDEALDATMRNEAADVLKVIGTRESVPSLEKAARGNNVPLRGPAMEALRQISAREKNPQPR